MPASGNMTVFSPQALGDCLKKAERLNSKKLFSKRKQTDFIRGPLFVILALSSVGSLSAREQWQIDRPDQPPTTPPSSSRWTAGGQYPTQPAPGQVPGLSGSNASQVPGLATVGWSGQENAVPGLAASGGAVPGLASGGWNGQAGGVPGLASQVPGFAHSSQLPGMGSQPAYGANTPGLAPGIAGGSSSQLPQGYKSGSQLPGFPGQLPANSGQGGSPVDAQVPGLVSPGVTGGMPGMPPLPVQPGQGGVMPDFLKNILGQRLKAGTVLTGVAEYGLSSKSSKRGDVFSIILPHGFGDGNEMLVPAGSKVLGVVVDAFSAKTQRVGMPGRLSISLKTLVFPDGRTTKLNAFIDHNPAHDQESEPKTRFGGFNAGDYGGALKGMFYSSVSGVSWVHNRQMRGKEFELKPGTPVSVKLNTSIDLAKMTNPAQAFQGTPGLAGVPAQPYLGPGGVPGLAAPQGAVPSLSGNGANGLPYGTPQPISGLPTVNGQPYGTPQPLSGLPTVNGQPYGTPQPVSGLPTVNGQPYGTPQPVSGLPTVNGQPYGTPQPVPQQGFSPAQGGGTFFPNNVQTPDQLNPGAQSLSQEQQQDPNSIFKTPISSPSVSTPEPF